MKLLILSLICCLGTACATASGHNWVVVKSRTCKVTGPDAKLPLYQQKEPLLECEQK